MEAVLRVVANFKMLTLSVLKCTFLGITIVPGFCHVVKVRIEHDYYLSMVAPLSRRNLTTLSCPLEAAK